MAEDAYLPQLPPLMSPRTPRALYGGSLNHLAYLLWFFPIVPFLRCGPNRKAAFRFLFSILRYLVFSRLLENPRQGKPYMVALKMESHVSRLVIRRSIAKPRRGIPFVRRKLIVVSISNCPGATFTARRKVAVVVFALFFHYLLHWSLVLLSFAAIGSLPLD